jgi:serine/threonine-protein phosphatase PGAM5
MVLSFFFRSSRVGGHASHFMVRSSPARWMLAAVAAGNVCLYGNSPDPHSDDSDHASTSWWPLAPLTTGATCLAEPRTKGQPQHPEKVLAKDDLFEGQCLKRQMHKPMVPYPAWDYNWDGKVTADTTLEAFRTGGNYMKGDSNKTSLNDQRRSGKTRHIILVRHGQYDESSKEDEYRKLTPLGRQQAIQTGKRLAELTKGSMNFSQDRFNGPCPVKAIYVSDMLRAKETAQLIAEQFRNVSLQHNDLLQAPDPLLNEALPAPMIPIRPDITGDVEEIDANQQRIERAFRKYFYRDNGDPNATSAEVGDDAAVFTFSDEEHEKDVFEIIVCHGNVIRYFFCRALQLPPEAWLRLCTYNCSLTYLVVRPNGLVSARMMGDIGHLTYEESSFSEYHGFKW